MIRGILWYKKPDWFNGTLQEWREHLKENEKSYQDYRKVYQDYKKNIFRIRNY